jgi:hypothetical protein
LNKLLLGLTAMPTYIVIEVILIVPDEDGWSCWCRLCIYCNLIYGMWKGGRTSKRWGSFWQTRDKSGWVFNSTSQEVGSPSK